MDESAAVDCNSVDEEMESYFLLHSVTQTFLYSRNLRIQCHWLDRENFEIFDLAVFSHILLLQLLKNLK